MREFFCVYAKIFGIYRNNIIFQMQKIKDFKTYVNENYSIDEGVLSDIKSAVTRSFSKVQQLVGKLRSYFSSSNIPVVTEGPKKGAKAINYFEPGKGGKSVLEQVREAYRGAPSVAWEAESETAFESKGASDPTEANYLGSDWEDVVNVSASELMDLLEEKFQTLVNTGWNKPEFIYGAPGIGKTEIIAQVCDKLGISLIPIELRFTMPVDLLGVPKVGNEPGASWDASGVTISNPPVMWPRTNWNEEALNQKREELAAAGMQKIEEALSEKDGPGGIIFFDEFNRADEFVANALMQFVQTRQLAGTNYKLPSKWMIVAAGNRPKDDKKFVKGIDQLGSAMIDRFDFCNYVPTVEDWEKYITTSKKEVFPGKTIGQIVMPEIIAFLKYSPGLNFYVPWDASKHGYATPRGWTDAAKAIEAKKMANDAKGKGKTISESEMKMILVRSVGSGPATQFMEFYKVITKFSMAQIGAPFNDPAKALDDASIRNLQRSGRIDPAMMYAWTAALVNYAVLNLKGQISPDQWKNFCFYWSEISKSQKACEYAATCLKMMTANFPSMMKDMKYRGPFQDWVTTCQKEVAEVSDLMAAGKI